MAWLSLPESEEDEEEKNVKGPDFVKWVDEFLLPNSGLRCTATELYGARCGLVHTHIAESNVSRKSEGRVREIYYAHGGQTVENLQKMLDFAGKTSVVPVKIEELQDRFISAIMRYRTYLADHPQEGEIALKRTGKFLVKMKPLKIN